MYVCMYVCTAHIQDTLVALEALAAWSSVQPSAPSNLTIKARSGALSKTVSIKPGDKVPEVMMMGSGDHLDISVEGICSMYSQQHIRLNILDSVPLLFPGY
jgi:hypothetical protein